MKVAAVVSALVASAGLGASCSAYADEDHGPASDWYACHVNQVAAYANRVHVRCSNFSTLGLYYYAVPTSSSAEAARLVTLGTAALASGKPLGIEAKLIVTPYIDGDYASWGCALQNCRRALSVAIDK